MSGVNIDIEENLYKIMTSSMLVPETWTPIKRLSIERAAGCFLVS